MHDDPRLSRGRLARFVEESLTRDADVVARRPLDVSAWVAPGGGPVPFAQAVAQPFVPVAPGYAWGRAWDTTWFRLVGEAPAEWFAPGFEVEVLLDLGFNGLRTGFQCEGLAYAPDGTVVKGVNPDNHYLTLRAPGSFEYLVEAAANPPMEAPFHGAYQPTRFGDYATAGDEPLYRLRSADVVRRCRAVTDLRDDVRLLADLEPELPEAAPRRAEILAALDRMLDAVDPADLAGTAEAGRAALRDALARPAHASAHRIVAVGHAHIDSAWLWPVRETARKVARSWANALSLMDEDPDFVFAASSAQQYAWVKERHPELFERIRARVAEGRFVPVGGMWVEPDVTMPSGESLVRQFVAGSRFFADEFGVEPEGVWLPDSFGYSGALPQIARLAGARWLLAQKMSWNQTNAIPHHTFAWEGIDGTRIFTHMPPVDTYGSDLRQPDLQRAERAFREAGHATLSLVPYGWSDGGGGPTREMLAQAHRATDLEGSPRVRLDSPVALFRAAEAEYPDPPVWSGELYLELHRGTLTSQAQTKRGNRRCERLLHEAELWAATAAVRVGHPYPYDELDAAWRTVLLLQFHDVLPGTSIAWVHREAERAHVEVAERLERLIADALAALTAGGDQSLLANGAPRPLDGVAALGVGSAATATNRATVEPTPDGGWRLRNGALTATVDATGHLVALVDLATGRDAIAPGERGNELTLYRDRPNTYEAWDVDAHHRRTAVPVDDVGDLTGAVDGAGAVVTLTRRFGDSAVRQELRLDRGATSLVVRTRVDWAEQRRLLRLSFPLDVRADRIACETQFGHVFRATHTNTSWDAARFEFCAHRWVHVGEPGFGVAIANERTYGHSVSRHTRPDGGTTTTVGLSLLRGPLYPDPAADRGTHEFVVALRPGADLAAAIEEGYALGIPRRALTGAPVEPIAAVDRPNVLVETVKLAEDRSGDLVLRLYESGGTATRATVGVSADVAGLELVDLLERPLPTDAVAALRPHVGGDRVALTLRPFQIVTLRVRRACPPTARPHAHDETSRGHNP